jgi:phospholipid/cholesterol/gamma-HCH transport system substrate-binding protein
MRFADQIVGTLVIIALAIIVIVILMLGKSQRWFSHDYRYKSYFNSASGISLNMPIQYKGFTIGHVKRIELTKEDNVEVIFTIFEEHNHRVKRGSMVEVQASPIGLGNTFMFHPGKGKDQLPEGALIPEVSSDAAKQLVKDGLADALESSDRINQILTQVDNLLKTINSALEGSTEAEETALGQVLVNLGDAAQSISGVAKELNVQIGPILKNIETITNSEGPIYKDLVEVFDSISGILQNLDRTIEFVPSQLPQVAILLSDLHSALAQAEKLVIALLNNPLLRGGVPELKETGPGSAIPRDLDFGAGESKE